MLFILILLLAIMSQNNFHKLMKLVTKSGCYTVHQQIQNIIDNDKSYVNHFDNRGWTPLIAACHNCSTFDTIDTIKLLINNGANVNIRADSGITALIYACKNVVFHGDKVIRVLLNAGAKVDIKDNRGLTALMYLCCNCGNNSIINLLIKAGANINLCNNSGHSALYCAAENGYFDIVKLLVDEGINIKLFGNDALCIAFLNCHYNIVLFLLELGCNKQCIINNDSPDNDSKLMRMLRNMHYKLIKNKSNILKLCKLYIDLGGDINYVCKFSRTTVLTHVCNCNMIFVADFLIRNGADLHFEDIMGYTAFGYLCDRENNHDIVRLCIDYGANINNAYLDYNCYGNLINKALDIQKMFLKFTRFRINAYYYSNYRKMLYLIFLSKNRLFNGIPFDILFWNIIPYLFIKNMA